MAKKSRSHKHSPKQRSPKAKPSNPFSRRRGLSVQVIAGVIAFALLAGGSLAQWRATTAPNISDETVTSTSSLPELPPLPASDVANELPPEPPMVYPSTAGYNAYTSGGLPPGALPHGIILPGMTNSAMPNPNAAYPTGMMPTMTQGYGVYDGVRQGFTGKEFDGETGLNYYGARYYSPTQGRFTSVDPENASADLEDPQSWNGYAYARNNPLKYVDPDGRKYLICKDGECYEHTDAQFANLRKNLGGFTLTGNGNFYERGNILDGEGNVVGQYAQTSIDNLEHRAIATIAGAVAPVPRAFAYLYGGSVLAGAGAGLIAAGPSTIAAAAGIGTTAATQSAVGLTTKAAAREAIARMAVSESAKAAARSAISRATTKSTIDVVKEGGNLIVRVARPGRDGHQVIESVIKSDGTKTVVQKAFDAAGRLVHYHPK